MAISSSHILDGVDTNNSFSTAAFTPVANKLYLLSIYDFVYDGHPTNNPVITTANGLNFVLINRLNYGGGDAASCVFLYRAMKPSGLSNGTVTIDFTADGSAQCIYSIDEYSGIDISGIDGSGAIAQSVNGSKVVGYTDPYYSIALSNFQKPSNGSHFITGIRGYNQYPAHTSSNMTSLFQHQDGAPVYRNSLSVWTRNRGTLNPNQTSNFDYQGGWLAAVAIEINSDTPATTSWTNKFTVTVDHTKVGFDGTFPVLITEAHVPAGFWDKVLPSGNDIKVLQNGSKLKREVVFVDADNHVLELWVKVPISTTVDAVFDIYYGKNSGGETNDTDTWDTNFSAVYHLKDGTTISCNDSTVNALNGTTRNTVYPTPGKIDGGAGMYYDDGHIRVTDPGAGSVLDRALNDELTISLWAKVYWGGGWQGLVCKGRDGGGNLNTNYELAFSGNWAPYTVGDGIAFFLTDSEAAWHSFASPIAYADIVYKHITLVHKFGDASSTKLYINGSEVSASWTMGDGSAAPVVNDENLNIGRAAPTEQLFGSADEVRISNNLRSAGWILTEYNNENDPSSFYSAGAEQVVSGGDFKSVERGILRGAGRGMA